MQKKVLWPPEKQTGSEEGIICSLLCVERGQTTAFSVLGMSAYTAESARLCICIRLVNIFIYCDLFISLCFWTFLQKFYWKSQVRSGKSELQSYLAQLKSRKIFVYNGLLDGFYNHN